MKRVVKLFLIVFPVLVWAQSTNQNYITTTEYLDPDNLADTKVTIKYFDGLGRPSQINAKKQSPNGKDIITQIEYDEFGRQVKDYLPAPSTIATGQFYENPEPFYEAYYDSDIYYSEKQLEASPLNRVLKQAAPGDDWALGSGHEIEFNYQTNLNGEVKIFTASTSYNSTNKIYNISLNRHDGATYTTGQLYKTITKDENHESDNDNTIEEFKNKEGQVILKRTYESGTKHDTYYVYDVYGNLTYVLPPLVNHNTAISSTVLDNLCYQYKYDDRNRLVEKKLPGKGWEYMVYDKQNRLVATQDENMRSTNPAINSFAQNSKVWQFTKYDKFGRIIYTGFTRSTANRITYQNAVNAKGSNNETRSANLNVGGININYTNSTAYPTTITKVLSVNYYDNYTFYDAIPVPTDISVLSPPANDLGITSKSLPTANYLAVTNAAGAVIGWEKTFTFYDTKSRPIRTYKKNHTGGYTQVDQDLDFRGKVVSRSTQHSRGSTNGGIITTERFTYGNAERLIQHTHQINEGPVEVLSNNYYDELGQLTMKNVGGKENYEVPLQSIDYKYNIRGWLTDINDVEDLYDQKSSEWMDLWAFKIEYNAPQNQNNGVRPLFNGNISETYWRTGKDNVQRSYGYTYDALNRLLAGYYRKPNANIVDVNNYNESLTYDKNGNILTLNRNGGFDYPISTGNQIDELHYTYNYNQLMKVTDATASSQGFNNGSSGSMSDYTYDDNGNMKTDKNKNITNIKYNHLNLPTEISFANNNKINYLYNAAGVKVEKKVKQGVNISKTEYIDGYQYQNEKLLFFPTAEGYVSYAQIPELQQVNKLSYVYNFTDHLGNIRLSYTEDPQNDHQLIILEENNYYPFGLQHPGYNKEIHEIDFWKYADLSQNEIIAYADHLIEIVPVVKGKYQYKYNGKELQDELGLDVYDYGWRQYDSAIGRWQAHDPLAEKYRRWSPYNYAVNNPIRFIDPDGMGVDDFIDIDKNTGKIKIIENDEKDTVRLIEDGKVVDSYVYGEDESFENENSIRQSQDINGLPISTTVVSRNSEKLFKFFKFAANSLVEFGFTKVKNLENNKTASVLTSSHDTGKEKIGSLVINKLLEMNNNFIITDIWHSHPEDRGGSVRNNRPSSFNDDGTRDDFAGDGYSLEIMKTLSPTKGRVPEKANIYVPSRNLHIIYNENTFKRIKIQ